MPRFVWQGALGLLVLALLGCSRLAISAGRVTVTGKLTVNNAPLRETWVVFLPEGGDSKRIAFGRTAADGSFTLNGYGLDEKGAFPGEYSVVISQLKDPPLAGSEMRGRETIPSPYSSPKNTPLKKTIPPGGGTIDIDLPKTALPGRR